MKGNIAFLFLTILFWEFVCAEPRVKSDSKSQVLQKKKKKLREDSLKPLTSGEEPKVNPATQPPVDKSLADDSNEANFEVEEQGKKVIKLVGDYNKYIQRPLAAGDTFTAGELLPVTQKLFEKVDNPGKGKGIVSSSKSPQHLADKIFQAFFMTSKRIVTLTDLDISGLDALQSLALVGDPATYEKFAERQATKVVNMNGQLVKALDGKRRSRYKMLHKVTGNSPNGNPNTKLIKKLGKNRHLVVSKRKNMKNDKASRKNSCRWSYECKEPTDMESCHLITKCSARRSEKKVDPAEYINSNVDVEPNVLAQFRKSLSINALDEEVEKIIERKLLTIRPNNEFTKEIEGLSEYFHKILLAEANEPKDAKTPIPDYDSSSEHRDKLNNVKKSFYESSTDMDTDSSYEDEWAAKKGGHSTKSKQKQQKK